MPDDENYPQERRYFLATETAMLKERSLAMQRQLDRIEESLLSHQEREEASLERNHTLLEELKIVVHELKESVDAKIHQVVDPVAEQVTKYKTALGYVTVIGGAVFTLVISFHDHLINFIKFIFTK